MKKERFIKTMYENHYEHIKDIMKLCNLKDESEINFYIKQILNHEEESDIFLPIIHLRNVYLYEEIEISTFYLFLSFSLSFSIDYPVYLKQFINSSANELINDKGLLKQRYIDFIFKPCEIIRRPWIIYFNNFNSLIVETAEMTSLIRLIQNFLEDETENSFVIYLTGKEGVGRKTHILYAAEKMGFDVLFVDIKQIFFNENFENYIQEVITECKLISSIPCFCNIDTLIDSEYNYRLQLLLFMMKPVSKIIFFTSKDNNCDLMLYNFTITELKIPMPEPLILKNIWQLYLNQHSLDESPDFDNLSNTYKLTPLQIKSFIVKAQNSAIANNSKTLQINSIYDICKSYNVEKLYSLGEPVSLSFTWNDLILPKDANILLQSVVNRIRYRNIVYNQWGFSSKFPYGRGISVLFEGPPGTGKTMAAQVLAKELNIPMYKIDISAIVSKYIGETEKNIKDIFDKASSIECILFFDEADSLFGKRTNVSDSKDRYANLETTYLLQKLEEHEGITILATNLIKNIDLAFKRRFQYIIPFVLPDELERKKIWKSVIPETVPISSNIDFEYLANQFQLSGSSIKNIALSSAFMAAANNTELNMKWILCAVKEELSKNSEAFPIKNLRQYEI